jgi:hypothetical protein
MNFREMEKFVILKLNECEGDIEDDATLTIATEHITNSPVAVSSTRILVYIDICKKIIFCFYKGNIINTKYFYPFLQGDIYCEKTKELYLLDSIKNEKPTYLLPHQPKNFSIYPKFTQKFVPKI